MCTSGSTGAPKAVVLTHDALAAAASRSAARLGQTAADTWFACIPLNHIGGFSVLTRGALFGTVPLISPKATGESLATALDAGATMVSVVPTVLERMPSADIARWSRVLVGGARAPDKMAKNCIATYGMTETGAGVVYNGLPLDDVRLEIADPDDAGVGTVHIAGPTLLRAYRGSQSAGLPALDDGWFRTSDLGRMDDGRLHVVGRADDAIVTGGEKVHPAVVERAILSVDGVMDACVLGLPDPQWGQRVVALVTADEAADLDERIVEHVRGELPRYCVPSVVLTVEEFPRLAGGKLDRRAAIRLASELVP